LSANQVAALNVDIRVPLGKPNVCYVRLSPHAFGSDGIEQVDKWLLPIIRSAVAKLEPLYGLVHVGDSGLNWYLYLCGIEDASFPVEYTEDLDAFSSGDVLCSKVPRVYWGNLLNRQHVRRLASTDDLRAWELGSREWQQYHNAVPTDEFRKQKSIPEARPGIRVEWPVRVYELDGGYVFFSLSSDPLDWSPNAGIDGLIKPEFKRLTKLFRSVNLAT
jgi:hypothetical protein